VDEGLATAPDDAGLLRCKSQLLLSRGSLAEALLLAERAVIGAPDTPAHRDDLIEILLRVGALSRVVEEANAALRLAPLRQQQLGSVIEALRRAGRSHDAIAVAELADREHPGTTAAVRLAGLYAAGGDPHRARACLIEGLSAVSAPLQIDSVMVADLVAVLRTEGVTDERDAALAQALERIAPHRRLEWLVSQHSPPATSVAPTDRRVLMERQPPNPALAAFFDRFPGQHPAAAAKRSSPDTDVVLHHLRDAFLYVFPTGFFVLDHNYQTTELSFPYVLQSHLEGVKSQSVKTSFDEAFFVGDMFGPSNYCHWVTDYLSRICIAASVATDALILIPRFRRLRFQQESLACLGIDDQRVTALEHGLHHVDSLLVLNTSSHDCRRYFQGGHTEYASVVFDRIPHLEPGESARLWLERGRSWGRSITNGEEVERVYTEYGYRGIDLGSLSFSDQIRTMSGATHVAGMHGAAFTNVVFCRPGTSVLEAFPLDYGTGAFATLSALKSLRYVPWIGSRTASGGLLNEDRKLRDTTVDLDLLRRGLEQCE
jgi:hypothetical protein